MNYYKVFDYFPHSLKTFIEKQTKILEFSKLSYFYHCLLYGFVFLRFLKGGHIDLQHKNIIIDENGSLKIMDLSYEKELSKKNLMIKSKYFSKELFSFGLMVLEMGILKILEDISHIGDLKNRIEANLQEFKRNYSELIGIEKKEFKKIYTEVKKCLDIHPIEKYDCIDLFKFNLNENKLSFHVFIENLDVLDNETFLEEIYKELEKNMKLKGENYIKNDGCIKEKDYKNLIEELMDENRLLKTKNQDLTKTLEQSKRINIQNDEKLSHNQKYLEYQDKIMKLNDEKISDLEKQKTKYDDKIKEKNNANIEKSEEKKKILLPQLYLPEYKPKLNERDFNDQNFALNLDKFDNYLFKDLWKFNKLPQISLKKVSLEFGSKCSKCEKKINDYDPQYYCYFCKIWFCEECGDHDFIGEKQGSDRLIHPHNLVWINVLLDLGMKDIDEYKIGTDKTFKENIQEHQGICTGCNIKLNGGFRYVCLNCPLQSDGFFDLCEKCMNCLRGKDDQLYYEEILDKLEILGHEIESHIFLRVCLGDN